MHVVAEHTDALAELVVRLALVGSGDLDCLLRILHASDSKFVIEDTTTFAGANTKTVALVVEHLSLWSHIQVIERLDPG